MGLAIATDESLLQILEANYRFAFRSFARAAGEFMLLQQAEGVDLGQIQEANVRIRDAQRNFREARDRLAGVVLAKRRERLQQRLTAEPARPELLTFVSRVELLLKEDHNSMYPVQDGLPGLESGMARGVQA
jgi:hypothetical protein